MTIQTKSKTRVNVGVDVRRGQLARYQVERLVMEATGRYQLLLAENAFGTRVDDQQAGGGAGRCGADQSG